jgi:dihydroflavonol-4-reductase
MNQIGIIGGLDFMGCDITLKFLADNYRVKVAVFSPSRGERPLIRTGISEHRNLEIWRFDPDDSYQLREFVRSSTVLIHCGLPLKLFENSEGIPIYVPIIQKTSVILGIVRETSTVKKVIFLASPVMHDFVDRFYSSGTFSATEESGAGRCISNHNAGKASFHANRLVQNIIRAFSANHLEIITVSPAGVKNNCLFNSREITSAGLKFLFVNKISHDPLFQRLNRVNILSTLWNVSDIPEMVFNHVGPCLAI